MSDKRVAENQLRDVKNLTAYRFNYNENLIPNICFYCGLFNNAVSSSYYMYVASSDMMINEE